MTSTSFELTEYLNESRPVRCWSRAFRTSILHTLRETSWGLTETANWAVGVISSNTTGILEATLATSKLTELWPSQNSSCNIFTYRKVLMSRDYILLKFKIILRCALSDTKQRLQNKLNHTLIRSSTLFLLETYNTCTKTFRTPNKVRCGSGISSQQSHLCPTLFQTPNFPPVFINVILKWIWIRVSSHSLVKAKSLVAPPRKIMMSRVWILSTSKDIKCFIFLQVSIELFSH